MPAGVFGQVKETTRDIQFLHNESFFATAQRKYVYIYDRSGVEVHCLQVCIHLRRFFSGGQARACTEC